MGRIERYYSTKFKNYAKNSKDKLTFLFSSIMNSILKYARKVVTSQSYSEKSDES